jgi:GNAT superfamily N-acetyltransferase
MSVAVIEEPLSTLADYAQIATHYDLRSDPAQWPSQFDVSKWGVLAAWREGRRVGAAVIAFDTPEVHMLEGRRDLAVLWDIRVAPKARREGIGTVLFRAVEAWAIARGCRQLKIETQNINGPACRFYERQGCVLGATNRGAYPEHPDEVQMLWYKELTPETRSDRCPG